MIHTLSPAQEAVRSSFFCLGMQLNLDSLEKDIKQVQMDVRKDTGSSGYLIYIQKAQLIYVTTRGNYLQDTGMDNAKAPPPPPYALRVLL